MRISVCEFLRLTFQTNWYYTGPGHWTESAGTRTAVRINGSQFQIYSRGRHTRTLTYYEGLSSNEARKLDRRTPRRRWTRRPKG